MEQRLSLITLGVRDLARAVAFYRALGWEPVPDDNEDVFFFQAGGMVVALWGRDELAADSCMADSGGWGGITLAYNARSPEEVDDVIEEARAAGATIGREPGTAFWGGHTALFSDSGGHRGEAATTPGGTTSDEGPVVLPTWPLTPPPRAPAPRGAAEPPRRRGPAPPPLA